MSDSQNPLILDASKTLEVPLAGIKLIEASAGTGKTYTIANLYLRHILAGRSPEQILVVTFTNAATEELRGRIRARIHAALLQLKQPLAGEDEFLSLLLDHWQNLDQESQRLQSQRLQLALRCMDQAAIFTIHGFCQRALTDHALSSGQDFDSTLLNDDQQIWDDALKDWWRKQSYTLGNEDWRLFHSCLVDLPTLLASQRNFRTGHQPRVLPEIDEDLSTLYQSWQLLDDELKNLAAEWQNNKNTVLEILITSKALSRSNKLPYHKDNLMRYFDQWEAYFASEQRLVIPDSLQYLGSETLDACSTATKRGTDPNLQDGFFAVVQQVFNRINQIKLRFRVRALIEANSFAQQRVRIIKQEARSIAYQDQLNLLIEALNGAEGPKLAEKLRKRFPAAMIDEFQDTDAIQYGIFKKLYFVDESFDYENMGDENISLTMIGDPKQAIYSFRGGDIFTYMKAKREVSVQHYSLSTNWRSEPELINAVNSIFTNRPAPFIYADSIDYAPVQAAQKKPAALLVDDSKATALTIWQIPQSQEQKNLGSEITYDLINVAIAEEIAYLIKGGIQNRIKIGAKPIGSGDIAVLVRTAREGNKLRAVLAQRGIRAVTIGKDKVFDSEEASGLYDLLNAINHHTDRDLLRAALANPLINLDYIEIAATIGDEARWQGWQEKIRELHLLWQHRGFIAMFQQLLQLLEIAQRITESSFAERRLTNLLHLAELAQQQSRLSPGFDALLAWYRTQIAEPAIDDTELRLENDESLVKIVTIHKSKGLEYPVVFVPFLWTCRPRPVDPGSVLLFHDENHSPVIDLGSGEHEQNKFTAEKERLAEDIRLAYVAITRACARVYLAWGDVGDGKMSGQPAKTALGYLLHPTQLVTDLDGNLPWAFNSGVDISGNLDKLVESSKASIEVVPLPRPTNESILDLAVKRDPLYPASFNRQPGADWLITSFTGLTRDIHQVAHGGSGGISGDSILDFPAGSHVGLLLHSVLEHLDFQGDIRVQCADLLPLFAPRFGLDSTDYQKTLSHWMETLVISPLNHNGLTLSALSSRQRLNELAFDFALDSFSTDKLNRLLAKISAAELPPINVESFRGMITGVIDLVFEYQGKYYLADYKSNYLGASLEDYCQQNLQRAVFDRRYDLQYLLYSVALHRYLSQRIADYQYQRDFGGVYYLFIRAMRPNQQSLPGVYFELPNYAELNALDTLLKASTIDNR